MRAASFLMAMSVLIVGWIVCFAAAAENPAPPVPPEVVQNSIGMKLVKIPAGEFQMGQHDSQNLDEKPRHTVRITKPYLLGVHEVTNAEWKRVMGSVPSKWKDDDRPVEQMTWDDAQEFCKKLSALPEEQKAGRTYRLPTEAEWEHACRAGVKTPGHYSFGTDPKTLGDHAWFETNSGSQTHPVGQKQANPWGLHDMHGNVWEWCSDWFCDYGPPVNDIPGVAIDPQGPSGGSDRVRRSGSWLEPAANLRSACRTGRIPTFRNANLGLRVAVSLPDSGPAEAAAGK